MKKTRTALAAAIAFTGLLSTGAFAAPLATLPDTGALATDQSVSLGFVSGAGSGQLSFHFDGYATLDGDDFWIDVFTLTLDGGLLLSGTWDLGGGGTDRVLDNPAAATVTRLGAQSMDIVVPLALSAGPHALVFSVGSPVTFEGTARSGFQGLGDEGWGLSQTVVTGPVPEPASALMLAAGLAALGTAARRRTPPTMAA